MGYVEYFRSGMSYSNQKKEILVEKTCQLLNYFAYRTKRVRLYWLPFLLSLLPLFIKDENGHFLKTDKKDFQITCINLEKVTISFLQTHLFYSTVLFNITIILFISLQIGYENHLLIFMYPLKKSVGFEQLKLILMYVHKM